VIDWFARWWRPDPPHDGVSLVESGNYEELDERLQQLEEQQEHVQRRLELLERRADPRGLLDG
jgi:hypothetical protein